MSLRKLAFGVCFLVATLLIGIPFANLAINGLPPSVYRNMGEIRVIETKNDFSRTYPVYTIVKTDKGTYCANGGSGIFEYGEDLWVNDKNLKRGPWEAKRIYENPPYAR